MALRRNHDAASRVLAMRSMAMVLGLTSSSFMADSAWSQTRITRLSEPVVVEVPSEDWLTSEPARMQPSLIAPSVDSSFGQRGVMVTQPPMPVPPSRPEPVPAPPTTKSYLPPMRPIGSVDISIAPKARGDVNQVPDSLVESALGKIETIQPLLISEGAWGSQPVARTASAIAYQPLYFEEVNLERYGRTHGVIQPALSGARFIATIPALPYAMTIHKSTQPYYWNWPYEAGYPAPRVRELPPVQLGALTVQGAATVGAAFIIP